MGLDGQCIADLNIGIRSIKDGFLILCDFLEFLSIGLEFHHFVEFVDSLGVEKFL